MVVNPHENSREEAKRAASRLSVKSAIVTSALANQTGGAHHVLVQEPTIPDDEPVPVLTPSHGDYYIPPEGSRVAIAEAGDDQRYAIGSVVPVDTVPSVDPGERVLSHPETKAAIKFEKDGTLNIWSGGAADEVIINGGSKGVIYDITTTKDGDGHVTDISLSRRSDIKI